MSDTSTGHCEVVVNRCMSLDGFIAAPSHVMDWGAGRDGIRFSPPDLPRIDLEPVSATRSRSVTILRFRICK